MLSKKSNGDWGLGIWGLAQAPKPKPPNPNPKPPQLKN